ncbi:hypothetical protein V6N11_060371 [Hibiscus sabdariffa]|uniref:t-SNARE coiled-coil homology domain-containing protein n=1 Tax=Hibiscus sabdariffa TaxID=183260 RepID=A0ABR2QQ45_9ROSI
MDVDAEASHDSRVESLAMDVEKLGSEMIDMKNSVNQMDEVKNKTNLLGKRRMWQDNKLWEDQKDLGVVEIPTGMEKKSMGGVERLAIGMPSEASVSSPDERQVEEEKLSKKGRGTDCKWFFVLIRFCDGWQDVRHYFRRHLIYWFGQKWGSRGHEGTVSTHVGEVGDYWLLTRCASLVMLVVARCAPSRRLSPLIAPTFTLALFR